MHRCLGPYLISSSPALCTWAQDFSLVPQVNGIKVVQPIGACFLWSVITGHSGLMRELGEGWGRLPGENPVTAGFSIPLAVPVPCEPCGFSRCAMESHICCRPPSHEAKLPNTLPALLQTLSCGPRESRQERQAPGWGAGGSWQVTSRED